MSFFEGLVSKVALIWDENSPIWRRQVVWWTWELWFFSVVSHWNTHEPSSLPWCQAASGREKHMKHRKGRKRRGQATANMFWMGWFLLGEFGSSSVIESQVGVKIRNAPIGSNWTLDLTNQDFQLAVVVERWFSHNKVWGFSFAAYFFVRCPFQSTAAQKKDSASCTTNCWDLAKYWLGWCRGATVPSVWNQTRGIKSPAQSMEDGLNWFMVNVGKYSIYGAYGHYFLLGRLFLFNRRPRCFSNEVNKCCVISLWHLFFVLANEFKLGIPWRFWFSFRLVKHEKLKWISHLKSHQKTTASNSKLRLIYKCLCIYIYFYNYIYTNTSQRCFYGWHIHIYI